MQADDDDSQPLKMKCHELLIRRVLMFVDRLSTAVEERNVFVYLLLVKFRQRERGVFETPIVSTGLPPALCLHGQFRPRTDGSVRSTGAQEERGPKATRLQQPTRRAI